MTEDRAKHWMRALADSGSPAPLPDFDQLWTRSRLEEEFERRRRILAPLAWFDAALQSAAGLAFAALLLWLSSA